jgi:hypothetical protein
MSASTGQQGDDEVNTISWDWLYDAAIFEVDDKAYNGRASDKAGAERTAQGWIKEPVKF